MSKCPHVKGASICALCILPPQRVHMPDLENALVRIRNNISELNQRIHAIEQYIRQLHGKSEADE